MKNNEIVLPSYDEYQERKRWARETAKEFGISLDEGEEHFVISPKYDSKGKLISRDMLSIRHDEIPLTKEDEKDLGKISIQGAIWLTKHYPKFSLYEAANERMGWAQAYAEEFEINFDKEHEQFIISGLNAKGKENKRELSLWKEIFVKIEINGVETKKMIPIETIIDMMQRFPNISANEVEEVIEKSGKKANEKIETEIKSENKGV